MSQWIGFPATGFDPSQPRPASDRRGPSTATAHRAGGQFAGSCVCRLLLATRPLRVHCLDLWRGKRRRSRWCRQARRPAPEREVVPLQGEEPSGAVLRLRAAQAAEQKHHAGSGADEEYQNLVFLFARHHKISEEMFGLRYHGGAKRRARRPGVRALQRPVQASAWRRTCADRRFSRKSNRSYGTKSRVVPISSRAIIKRDIPIRLRTLPRKIAIGARPLDASFGVSQSCLGAGPPFSPVHGTCRVAVVGPAFMPGRGDGVGHPS